MHLSAAAFSKSLIIFFCICLTLFVDKIFAAAGYCYQCNSRNTKCGMDVDSSLKRDATPCNGQCFTRINGDDGNIISRGCSWQYGFMKPEEPNTLIPKGNSVWMFCDTSYCNYEATALLNAICYQPICNFLSFPDDCSLPNVDKICGRFCGNKLCGGRSIQRRRRVRYFRHRG